MGQISDLCTFNQFLFLMVYSLFTCSKPLFLQESGLFDEVTLFKMRHLVLLQKSTFPQEVAVNKHQISPHKQSENPLEVLLND